MIETKDLIGIPYVSQGRDASGVDCWGLVRLIFLQRGIELPSLADAYADASDGEQAAQALLRHREGWQPVPVAEEGDVLLFRIMGAESHVGVYLGEQSFIHARDGHGVCIERLDGIQWRSRLAGVYRYAPNAVQLTGALHPLRTAVMTASAQAGQSLRAMIEAQGLPPELLQYGHAWLNGVPVPFESWGDCVPLAGDRVEFRVVPRGGGNPLRTILMVVVMVVAAWVSGPAGVAALSSTFGAAAGTAAAVAGAAVMAAGTMLVNAIAPIRPANQEADASQGRGLLVLNGGANTEAQYGAIPVVLGRHRFTPPLAASYATSNTSSDNYLHLLLCWGYGPLQIDDLRIGNTPISGYKSVTLKTVTGSESDYDARLAEVLDLYGRDTTEENIGVTLEQASGWHVRTSAADSTRLDVVLAWPQGLFGLNAKGERQLRDTIVDVEYRRVGTSAWYNLTGPTVRAPGKSFTLPEQPGATGYNQTVVIAPNYRWTTFYVLLGVIYAAAGDVSQSPDINHIWWSDADHHVAYAARPKLPDGATPLYHVCVSGNTQYSQIDVRPVTDSGGAQTQPAYTGFALTRIGLKYTIAGGTLTLQQTAIAFNRMTKDAFTHTVSIPVDAGQYEVRVKRVDNDKQYAGDDSNQSYEVCQWAVLRSVATNRRPCTPPARLAMTALRIKATGQLNGRIEGINALVSCIIARASGQKVISSNPADLYRLVLRHPGNAKAVTDAGLDLAGLDAWAQFCADRGLHYNGVVTDAKPLLEVLKDICAAGRASPRLADGKWGVVVDCPKTQIVQHFTPHNSWGFEATRVLPELPHAFRVHFINELKQYQPDERIVYADGYTSSTATLFEQLEFPGVTHPDQIHKLARFHLAQVKLRPEEYTINVDVEHLIAGRGDRVKVVHDVPMWGLGSGRVKEVISSTQLLLDEEWPMDAGMQYGIRIRRQDGSSVTATVAAQAEAGDYDTVTLTAPLTGVFSGDLCLFGELGQESVDCLVKAIESTGDLTARVTLVDYAPGVFEADSEAIPDFESNLTRPPVGQREQITQQPLLLSVESGTSALIVEPTGRMLPALRVAWRNPEALQADVSMLELQMKPAQDELWGQSQLLPLAQLSATFADVSEGVAYDVRARYISQLGAGGPWTDLASAHVVIGKAEPPSVPQGLTAVVDPAGFVDLSWQDVPDADLAFYELRLADAGWGSDADCWRTPRGPYRLTLRAGGAHQLSLRAVDTSGNYSLTSARFDLVISAPAAPTGFRTTVVDNTVMFYWSEPASQLAIDSYELRRGDSWATAEVVGTKYGLFTTVSEPRGGQFTYWLSAIDMAGNQSDPVSTRAQVSAPPDFVLVSEQHFTPDQLTANGVIEQGRLYCPVAAAETWEQHFASRSWASPADQVAAGYPVYVQPQVGSGVIERIVDFGAVLDTTRVMVSLASSAIAGSPALSVEIYTSTTGSSWMLAAAADAVITGGFRYLKVIYTISGGVVAVSKLAVTLDRKEKAAGGSVAALAADAGGTLVPITGFADVSAINATPRGTTPLNCVVSFTDVPNPTGFRVLVFNSSGVRVSATVDYTIRGV